MKKLIFIISAVLIIGSISAQDNRSLELNERLQERKKLFMVKQLQLTEKEEADFWPVYENFQKELSSLRDKYQKPDLSLLSDDEADDVLDDMISREQEMLDLKKKYIGEMKGVINTRKVIKLFKLENEFKKNLLKNYRDQLTGGKHERYKGFDRNK